MSKNTKTAAGAGALVIEGLAEATKGKQALAAKLADLQAKKKKAAKAIGERAKKLSRLQELQSTKNPQIQPDTLRPSEEGELIGGKEAKGWVVEIACETCGKQRLVNTQDAFQVRYCELHKADARKKASKERRTAAKTEKLMALDEAELAKQVAELEAELAA